MRIPQYIVLIVFTGFLSKLHFANINDLLIPEEGESICIFENITDDVNDEQAFVIGLFLGAVEKSICLKKMKQRTIEGCIYIETPPPENL